MIPRAFPLISKKSNSQFTFDTTIFFFFFFCSDVIDEWDDECEPDTFWPPLHVNRKDTGLDWTFGLLDSVTKRVAKLLSIVLVWYPSLARNYCLKKYISKKFVKWTQTLKLLNELKPFHFGNANL